MSLIGKMLCPKVPFEVIDGISQELGIHLESGQWTVCLVGAALSDALGPDEAYALLQGASGQGVSPEWADALGRDMAEVQGLSDGWEGFPANPSEYGFTDEHREMYYKAHDRGAELADEFWGETG